MKLAYNSKIRARFLQLSFSPIPSSISSPSWERLPPGFTAPIYPIIPLRQIRLDFDSVPVDEVATSALLVPMILEEVRKVARTPTEVDYLCRNLPPPPPGVKFMVFKVIVDTKTNGFIQFWLPYSQRSSVNTPSTMPVTFILLLGFMCGLAGKICVDTLGGNGYYWLLHWEILCMVHFLANIFPSVFYRMLYGSISVTTHMKAKGRFVPFWTRRLVFNLLLSFVYPAMCGLLPFASLADWMEQIS